MARFIRMGPEREKSSKYIRHQNTRERERRLKVLKKLALAKSVKCNG